MEPRKQAIIDALAKFINQRSGIEFGNYGDAKAFRAEQRSIYTDLKQARVLLAAVKWRDGIDADALIKAAERAYSGRLTIREVHTCRLVRGAYPADTKCDGETHLSFCEDGKNCEVRIDYTTGQYFPTEYRRAVCAVLASALWEYTRDRAMPAPASACNGDRIYCDHVRKRMVSAGDWLRAHFRREFGRSIAARWFT